MQSVIFNLRILHRTIEIISLCFAFRDSSELFPAFRHKLWCAPWLDESNIKQVWCSEYCIFNSYLFDLENDEFHSSLFVLHEWISLFMPDAFHRLAVEDRSSVVLSPRQTDREECSVCLCFWSVNRVITLHVITSTVHHRYKFKRNRDPVWFDNTGLSLIESLVAILKPLLFCKAF